MYKSKQCDVCGSTFVPLSSVTKRCSDKCKRLFKKKWSATRYVNHREEILEYGKRYHKANPEKARIRSRRYEVKHKEKRRGNSASKEYTVKAWKEYYEAHSEELKQRAKTYALQNPEKIKLYRTKRRAVTRGSRAYTIKVRDSRRALARYRHCCAYCNSSLIQVHWDHVLPVSRGGTHSVGNLLPTCPDCNLQKTSKTLTEWFQYRRLLGLDRLKGLAIL